MSSRKHKMISRIFVTCLVVLLAGCSSNHTNSQFTVRVSGNTNGEAYEGQCTAQRARFFSRESIAQSLEIKGTVISITQPQDYETTAFFIYCSIANQSAMGTIKVELLRDDTVVASAQSSSPAMPAILEFGEKP